MSWIKTNLQPGEKSLFETKPFKGQMIRSVILWLFFIGLIGFVAKSGLALVLLVFPIVSFLRYNSTEYILTNRRVIRKTGFLSVSTDEIPLDKITNVRLGQKLTGRMSDSGNLLIESSARDGQLLFANTEKIKELKASILEAQEVLQNFKIQHQAESMASVILSKHAEVASGPAAEPHLSKKEKLEELQGLLDSGLISSDEFTTQRTKVLEG